MLINFRSLFDPQNLVDGYIMDKHLDRAQHLVYYQVSGEPGIAGCNAVAVWSSRRSDVYFVRAHTYLLIIAA